VTKREPAEKVLGFFFGESQEQVCIETRGRSAMGTPGKGEFLKNRKKGFPIRMEKRKLVQGAKNEKEG